MVAGIRLDIDKLKPLWNNTNTSVNWGEADIPILRGIDKIVLDGESDVTLQPETDPLLKGHTVRVLFVPEDVPGRVQVVVDGVFVALYTYWGQGFIKRSYTAFTGKSL